MTNWGDMPPELKWMIVDRMDIVTRFRLKMCSKSDKSIVESVLFHCDEVMVIPHESDQLFWEWSFPEGRVCYDKRTTTLSIKIQGKERFIKLSSAEECSEMIRCMFRAFMMPQNVRIGRFTTYLNLDYLFPNRDITIHAKSVHLYNQNRTANKAWLDVLAKPPDVLIIRYGWDGIESHPMVQNVNHLVLYDPTDVENEHLMNFKAKILHICSSKITEEGINAYIKKVIHDDYPISSSMGFKRDVNSKWNKIIEGLDYKVIMKRKGDEYDIWEDEENEDMELSWDDQEQGEIYKNVRGSIEARVKMSPQKDIILSLEFDHFPQYSPTEPEYEVNMRVVKKGELI